MNTLRFLVKKYLKYFYYFYTYLRYRIFISLGLSLVVGVLDGFGLAMFLPLLQMVDGESTANAEGLGRLAFLVEAMEDLGIAVTIRAILLVILFFFVLKGIAKFIEAYYKMILSRYFMRKLRFDNIDKLSGYNYKAFVTTDIGRLQSTLSGEVGKVLGAYKSYFITVQAAIMVLVYVVLAFMTNGQFALLVVVGALLSNLIYQQLYKKTVEASRKLTKGGHKFQALLIQQVAFFKYLKATGLIGSYAKKLKSIILEMEEVSLKMGWYNAIVSSTKEPLIVLVVIGVILVHVTWFSQSLGAIILSLLFFHRSLTFLLNLQNNWNAFLTNAGSLENMTSFMQELKAEQEVHGNKRVTRFQDNLLLERVEFAYGETMVLRDINLRIAKNETIAFVGESGSGKTTLVNILSGLLRVDTGEFTIDGTNAKALDIVSYQQRIGYITQDPVVFSDTIYNNITFWAEPTSVNIARFWEALRKASIYDFVMELKEKENSFLGNNGILVSGGQKQRFSIARELYKNIDILIMDEATSALDSETERAIQENIDALKGHYTILIIAHRLSTIKNADRVVLLKKGKIETIGTFEDLKQTSKLFEKMVELQEV